MVAHGDDLGGYVRYKLASGRRSSMKTRGCFGLERRSLIRLSRACFIARMAEQGLAREREANPPGQSQ